MSSASASSSSRPLHHDNAIILQSGGATSTSAVAHAYPSQAKRRLEAMTASIDHKLAVVFTVLLTLYAMVTFGTWVRIESQGDISKSPVISAVSTSHSVATTRDTTRVVAGGVIVPPMVRVEDIHDIQTLQHTFPVHVGDDMEEIPFGHNLR